MTATSMFDFAYSPRGEVPTMPGVYAVTAILDPNANTTVLVLKDGGWFFPSGNQFTGTPSNYRFCRIVPADAPLQPITDAAEIVDGDGVVFVTVATLSVGATKLATNAIAAMRQGLTVYRLNLAPPPEPVIKCMARHKRPPAGGDWYVTARRQGDKLIKVDWGDTDYTTDFEFAFDLPNGDA